MSTITLIRHGMTQANERHLYCGSTDLPLSPEGRQALQALQYGAVKGRFFTSGMRRTEETLAILFGSVPHEMLPEFREIDFGRFEMHSYDELKDDLQYQTWITGDNHRNIPPGGESGEAMTARVLAAFEQLRKRNEDIVLITHGGVIAAIMASLFPQENKNLYQWQPKPGHGYRISGEGYTALP